ncbi:MAG: AraC family transcriptional regulator [Burkholderiales bacterium]
MSTAIRIFQGKFGRVALLDMNGPLVTHAHSQCHVLLKARGADTFFSVRDKLQPLTDETAVLVNSWEPHSYAHQNPDAPRTVILALYIEPAWLSEIENKLTSSGHPGFFQQPCVRITKVIRRQTDALAMQMFCGEQPGELELETTLSNLMMSVIDAFSEWRSIRIGTGVRQPPVHDRRIRRAVMFMRANVGTELDIDRLAREACLSRAHFFKLFQQCTELTPHVYANVLRMEVAIHGLAETNQSLCSISESLGFSAQSHFTRFFQQHLGIVPSQYRRVVDLYQDGADERERPVVR